MIARDDVRVKQERRKARSKRNDQQERERVVRCLGRLLSGTKRALRRGCQVLKRDDMFRTE